MAPMEFSGVALVTGAAGSGIGNATARAFAAAGCRSIAITDINAELLRQTSQQLTSEFPDIRVYSEAGDISCPAFVDAFVTAAARELGRLDYCVNCAGIIGNDKASADSSVEDFDRINKVNYRGCWLSSRAQLKVMMAQEPLESKVWSAKRPPQRGSIVNVASQLGLVGKPRAPAYCASKAAVIAMTRSDAIDYAQHGIRVNCICPGVIETPMVTANPQYQARFEAASEMAPIGRVGQPEEVADAILFLSSNLASFVQGHALVADGGYIIN